MLSLYALALFAGAALLFVVQPLAGKLLLPLLGGGPGVWNSCMVFFQVALLAGYLFAHALSRVGRLRVQVVVYATVWAAGGALLPIGLRGTGWVEQAPPVWATLLVLGLGFGGPFAVVSGVAPLLQRWFSRTDHPRAANPYVLYAVSNAGSMLALLSYPLVVEPLVTLHAQRWLWSGAYIALGVLVVSAGVVAVRRERVATREPGGGAAERAGAVPGWTGEPGLRAAAMWVALSAAPSALVIGATAYITTDVAAVPLLWIAPLALYLLTFIVGFSGWGSVAGRVAGVVLVPAALTAAAIFVTDARSPMGWIVAAHLALLFVGSLACHGRLADLRPADAAHLTRYYLLISFGGVLGGVLTTMVAPMVFSTVAEYPLAIVAVCLLRPVRSAPSAATLTARVAGAAMDSAAPMLALALMVTIGRHPPAPLTVPVPLQGWFGHSLSLAPLLWFLPFVVGLIVTRRRWGAGLVVATMMVLPFSGSRGFDRGGDLVYVERTFFGVHRVYRLGDGKTARHELWHGRIVHGTQFLEKPYRNNPVSYYFGGGPISNVFVELYGRAEPERSAEGLAPLRRAALVGLGTGTTAAYGREGVEFNYYEIDPAVVRIASDPALFGYVERSRAKVGVVVGDARRTLSRAAPGSYGLILVDAFSSDAIPVHLLTREAVELYFSQLNQDGLLALHITNRYVRLEPVAAAIAAELGLTALVREDLDVSAVQTGLGKSGSVVVVLARRPEALGNLRNNEEWRPAAAEPGVDAWRDDYANVLRVFRWR